MSMEADTTQRVRDLLTQQVASNPALARQALEEGRWADLYRPVLDEVSREQQLLQWLASDKPDARAVRDLMARRVYERARAQAAATAHKAVELD